MTTTPRVDRPPVELPATSTVLADVWEALTSLATAADDLPWTLVGEQMVLLHGLEHGRAPHRLSTDIDTAVDVRAARDALARLVTILADLGYCPGTTQPGDRLPTPTRQSSCWLVEPAKTGPALRAMPLQLPIGRARVGVHPLERRPRDEPVVAERRRDDVHPSHLHRLAVDRQREPSNVIDKRLDGNDRRKFRCSERATSGLDPLRSNRGTRSEKARGILHRGASTPEHRLATLRGFARNSSHPLEPLALTEVDEHLVGSVIVQEDADASPIRISGI